MNGKKDIKFISWDNPALSWTDSTMNRKTKLAMKSVSIPLHIAIQIKGILWLFGIKWNGWEDEEGEGRE